MEACPHSLTTLQSSYKRPDRPCTAATAAYILNTTARLPANSEMTTVEASKGLCGLLGASYYLLTTPANGPNSSRTAYAPATATNRLNTTPYTPQFLRYRTI